MAGILDSVNQRTQLVGQNRLELLLFKLNGRQRFGINVFKVREVLQCPRLTSMPKLNPFVRGVANVRGSTISVIDLSLPLAEKRLKIYKIGSLLLPNITDQFRGSWWVRLNESLISIGMNHASAVRACSI